jgi:hypothetical protein
MKNNLSYLNDEIDIVQFEVYEARRTEPQLKKTLKDYGPFIRGAK